MRPSCERAGSDDRRSDDRRRSFAASQVPPPIAGEGGGGDFLSAAFEAMDHRRIRYAYRKGSEQVNLYAPGSEVDILIDPLEMRDAQKFFPSHVVLGDAAALDDGVCAEGKEQVGIGPDELAHGEEQQSLRTAHHLAGGDVVARPMPGALQAAVAKDSTLAEGCEQVAAGVGDGKGSPVRDADREASRRGVDRHHTGAAQL